MLSLKVFLASAAAILLTSAAGAEEAAPSSSVPILNGDNFEKFITDNPITLVKFMAPWCGHCKKLAPEYEAAAKELMEMDPKVPLVEVDATVDQKLAEQYQVRGFPTIFLFRNGKPEPYSGGRTKQLIVEWVQKMTGPAITWFDSQTEAMKEVTDPTTGKTSSQVIFVGAFPAKNHDKVQMFEKIASTNRLKGTFRAYVDSSLTQPQLTAVRTNEEHITTKLDTEKELESFLEAEHIPLFGQISGENYAAYSARSDNWVWFAGEQADFEKYGTPIRKVSKNYRTEFNFVWIDTNELKHHAESALGLHEFPSIAVLYERAKYHLPTSDMNEKGLTKFIESVKAGNAKRFLKSEPVPTSNDGPVKVVVGTQFADIVLQKDKDVFLKVYAPWCGHCKKIAPLWEQLGERTKESKNFVVAKLDGTANEIEPSGFDFHGFPTLFFVKAGSKTPIPYDGDRTFEAFVEFAKKHATHPITISDAPEGDEKDEL